MTRSSLCTYTHITSNHSRGRGGNRVCKITPHYMCAYWSGRGCADYFASTSRQASSNYCIGVNGDIAMSVDEDDRAWTSASGWNDRQAITIECGNLSDSSLTQATWNSLVNLCVDICKRYGFRLTYDGTRNGTLTEHHMFASTDCPGNWLHANMSRLAKEVNAKLDGSSASTSYPTSTSVNAKTGTGFVGSYVVSNTDVLNVRVAPSITASISGTLPKDYVVVLDDWYAKADGYIWGRYTTTKGNTRYVAVGKATGSVDTNSDYLIRCGSTSAKTSTSNPVDFHAGTYTFKYEMNVRKLPTTQAAIAAVYKAGQSVSVNRVFSQNGYIWGEYVGNSGYYRYVALATSDGSIRYVE